jgi:HD superfamily phosphohydrolase
MFQQVYFHKAARSAEWMIGAILARVAELLRGGTRVEGVPAAIAAMAVGKKVTLTEYLELDDNVLFCAMHAWESSSDKILADLTRRVRSRSLFKTLELYGHTDQAGRASLATARDIAKRRGFLPESYVGLDVASDMPFADEHDPLSVVFPNGVTRKPGDVSFLLGRLRGETVTRARLIFASELRDEIRSALL